MGGKAKTDQEEADSRGWSLDEWLARKADSAWDKANKSDEAFDRDYYQKGLTGYQQSERDWQKTHPGQPYPTQGSTGFMGSYGQGSSGPATNNPPPSSLTTQQQNEEATQRQTRENRPNQYGPFGSSEWTVGPDGRPVQTTSLGPILDQASTALQQQALANALRGFDTGEDARKQATDAAYDQAVARLNPQWAQRDEHLASTLANQGLDPTSAAYRAAMSQQSAQRNDAFTSAMNAAQTRGAEAQRAVFDQEMRRAQLPYEQMGQMYGLSHPFGFNAASRTPTESPDAAAQLAWQKVQHGEQLTAEETEALMRATSSLFNATRSSF